MWFCCTKIGLVFSLSIYSFDLFNNYFMVYYFNGIVKHNIKQMEIQITTRIDNVCSTLFVRI